MAKKQHEDKNPPEFIKEAKKRLKKRRPEYKKKRVIVPSITAAILVILGITAAIHSTFFQSTDDAFVEGRLVSIAPRVAAPVVKLLVDDNQEVEAGELLVELDPKDLNALKILAKGYERIKAKDLAIDTYKKYLERVTDPVDYKMAKDRLDKLDNLGSSEAEESVGLIDKIMGFFNKG